MWDKTANGIHPPGTKPPLYETEMGRNLFTPQ